MKIQFVNLFFVCGIFSSCGQSLQSNLETNTVMSNDTSKVMKSEEEWKKKLTPEQYKVLRLKGTDAPHSGKYTDFNQKGSYVCAACGNELFSSEMKFESSCGWPSFDREIAGGKIKTVKDTSYGMSRTEILCAKCGSHLGHIFDDGPTETGVRYCVNSTSLDFLDPTAVHKK